MSIIPINKENWEGTFSYELENELGEYKEVQVKWTMTLETHQDSFIGTRIDEETKDLFIEPIPVEGFKEGDDISFIVNYPYNYYSDNDTGEVIPLKDEAHPGVRYYGTFDKYTMKYKGRWEVEFRDEPIGDFQEEWIVHYFGGDWEMKKKKN